jgi:hypothetical protein
MKRAADKMQILAHYRARSNPVYSDALLREEVP